MPFILTTVGGFSSRLPPVVIEWVIQKQLTRRLIDCSDDAVMLNPAQVQRLQRLRIHVRGAREGSVANPGRELGKDYRTLRCDKPEDRWLEVDGASAPYAVFEVRTGEAAHGGLFCAYDEAYSFGELASALRESMRGVPETGYALMYSGSRAPQVVA